MAITKQVKISSDFITLSQFLKIVDLISSGGEAKMFLLDAKITINGEKDNRRGRKLRKDDLIDINGNIYKIC